MTDKGTRHAQKRMLTSIWHRQKVELCSRIDTGNPICSVRVRASHLRLVGPIPRLALTPLIDVVESYVCALHGTLFLIATSLSSSTIEKTSSRNSRGILILFSHASSLRRRQPSARAGPICTSPSVFACSFGSHIIPARSACNDLQLILVLGGPRHL